MSQEVIEDLKKIASNKDALTKFLSSDASEKIKKIAPKLVDALHSVLSFTVNSLKETDPAAHQTIQATLGPHIEQIQNAKGTPVAEKVMISKGGSFWHSIGHWFSHAAHTVANGVKSAANTVYNKAIKPAIHGLEEAGEWVYDHRKIISKAIDIATKVLAVLPIPYVQEAAMELKPFVSTANTFIQGTGLRRRIRI